ncbi:MAG: LacI family DNA-binding transcriptional regulator [Anaerolineae bacterium]|nr:LacI family DNA-binding transcriptional regulator [Anaerolineae bacterium]MCB9458676.1 LacI family DNA-binding transcriptional regulator [Anaerolineaceae bacterium]
MNPKTKPTIKDIAEAAGVSPMTVSRVLNNKGGSKETRERILQIADEIGYVANPMARGLRSRSQTIGIMIGDPRRPFVGELLHQLSLASDRFGYGLMLYAQGTEEFRTRHEHYAALLTNGLNDGVIFNTLVDHTAFLPYLKQNNIPYVLLDYSDTDEPSVVSTDHRGMVDATRHLLALGHKKIGFITGPMNNRHANERLAGFRASLGEVGIPVDESLILEGDFSQISGFRAGRKLLAGETVPTAIIASNDGMAFGVMEALRERGLEIGTDVSVIGFDDIPMAAQVEPALTTVHQDVSYIAKEAVELLTNLIEGRSTTTLKRQVPTNLIIRQSTNRPRPGA